MARKSHFQPSVEMGMKNVDKNIDKRNKQRFGSKKTRHDAMKMDIRVDCVAIKHPNHCLLFLSMSLSTLFMCLFTEG